MSRADRRDDGPLHDIPLLTLYGIGFSGVGAGPGARQPRCFMALAEQQEPAAPAADRRCATSGDPVRVAEAAGAAAIGARVICATCCDVIWDAARQTRATLEQRARLRLAITGALEQASRVVDFAYPHRRRRRDLSGQPVRAPLPRHAHRHRTGPGAYVEFRVRRPGVVRHRDHAKASLRGAKRRSIQRRDEAGLLATLQ